MSDADARLIDSHAHLDFPQLSGRLDEVMSNAAAAGVEHIVTIGITYETALAAIDIAKRYENVSAAAGIHPNESGEHFGEFAKLAALFDGGGLVAVGETGLDYYRDRTPAARQVESFTAHLELALAKDLPVIIHVRDAYDEALAVVDAVGGSPRGVFHCYSGTIDFAREVLARGFHISFAGQVTYKNADDLRQVAAELPLERMLVETDCPFLAPVPKRGKDNEPAFVRHTAEKIAAVKGVSLTEVAKATTENARRLFGIGNFNHGRKK